MNIYYIMTMPQMRLWARHQNVCPELTPEQAYTNKILYKNHDISPRNLSGRREVIILSL